MNTASLNAHKSIRKLTTSGICLALCLLLPFLTGQIPQIGAALSPMHIPVLLAGFIAGPFHAAIVGVLAPILRFSIFGMPPLLPTGIAMSFELAVYGLATGFMYRMLPKRNVSIYISLVSAMLMGRVVWGIMRYLLSGIIGPPFTLEMFMLGAFVNAVPGIITHIILIPAIIIGMRKANLLIE